MASKILKLGRPIAIQGKEEINFTELLLQFSQLDNNLIISEAGNALPNAKEADE